MPKWGYSVTGLDPSKTVKASGRERRVSPKATREVCRAIKGMKLDDAKSFLGKVIDKKMPVAFARYKKEVPHRRGLERGYAGRYPVKAASEVLNVLENAESNAENKGLDHEKLRIIHAAAQRARQTKKMIPRAFGRASPYFEQQTHIELVLSEMPG
ncbi:MAG TPA: 50S ribosomal protein L22 [archaeon]|nr:50S ribosomal protein L22 [archaeon]